MRLTAETAQLVSDAVWESCLIEFRPDCCIVAGAVTCDLLADLGHRARPISVRVGIINAAGRRMHEQGTPKIEAGPAWAAFGACSVGLGWPGDPRPRRWNGHLAVVANDRWLIDPTIAQVSMAPRGLELVPYAGEIPEPRARIWTAGAEYVIDPPDPSGPTIVYTSRAGDTSFRGSPNWRDKPAIRRAVYRCRVLLGTWGVL